MRLPENMEFGTTFKIGVVPYIAPAGEARRYLVLSFKDHVNDNHLLCIGKRLLKENGAFRKIREEDFPLREEELEAPETAAKREAQEELGLDIHDDERLQYLGVQHYDAFHRPSLSYTKVPIHLYAVEITPEHAQGQQDYHGHAAGKETRGLWKSYEEFRSQGRLDHIILLKQVDEFVNQEHTA